jgi:hypothetical protein
MNIAVTSRRARCVCLHERVRRPVELPRVSIPHDPEAAAGDREPDGRRDLFPTQRNAPRVIPYATSYFQLASGLVTERR